MPKIQADHLPLVGLQGRHPFDALAIDLLVGPVHYRILLARQSVPVTFTDALVQRYLAETVDC
jgi:hypothetical protein